MAGMAAEELFLGETGTGPAADLAAATEVAAAMVGSLGMGGSLISYDAVSEGPISSRNIVGRVLSDPEGKGRVEELLATQKVQAGKVLSENQDVVEALRDALLERDELVGEEISNVIVGALERRRVIRLPDPLPRS